MTPSQTSSRAEGDPSGKVTYATPALEKGLDILELLAHQPAGLTKSEISRHLGRTVSEIFRMLLCLEQRGYIAQADADRYTLTLKLFKLVQEHPPTERLITEALPVMHRVAHDVQQSCHLGVIEGPQVIILTQVNAPTPVGLYVKPGSTVDLFEASSAYVMLAYQDASQGARILEEWKRATGKQLPEDLGKHLSRVRRQGYEKRTSYKVKGVLNISFPIFGERGSALGALTIPYIEQLEDSASIDSIVKVLRAAALEVTHAVGGVAPKELPTG